jgi:hypothetical protein
MKTYNFENVTQTVEQFKDQPLLFEPRNDFAYSNYGFQIIGAIVESVLNETFEKAINDMLKEIEMNSTCAEKHDMIITQRVRYYSKDNEDLMNVTQVLNAPNFDDLVSIVAQ